MRVCVIGNGTSVRGSGFGKTIDSMDAVIRVHEWDGNNPNDFGTKYTYGIMPLWYKTAIPQITLTPEKGWIFYSFGRHNLNNYPKSHNGKKVYLYQVDDFFNEILERDLAPTRGLAGIYLADKKIKPDEIYLIGFDSVLLGVGGNDRHDFKYEKKMLNQMNAKIIDMRNK